MRHRRLAALAAAGSLAFLTTSCDDDPAGVPAACGTTLPSDEGPGDAANHFPLSDGSTWHYRVLDRATRDGAETTHRARVRITGTRAVAGLEAKVAALTDLDDADAPASEVLLAKGPAAVVRLPDPGDPLSAAIGPRELLEFPLEAGRSFTQTHCVDLDLGIDEDGDGVGERVDVHAEVTIVGGETVAVPAGTFPAMRVETHAWLAVQRSSGGAVASERIQRDWYAPGVGRVRSVVEDTATGALHEESLIGFRVEGAEGGLVELRTLATDLAPASSDESMPGRPALAFDGAAHLLVSAVSTGTWGQDTLRAHRLAADGSVGAPFAPTSRSGTGFRPAAAFNGTHHLVVSAACGTSCDALFAQRLSPGGSLLDDAAGSDLPTRGSGVYAPAVASDGDGWMVVHTEYAVEGLRATRVAADGTVPATVDLGSPWSSLATGPAIAFGGGQYLLAWAEGAIAIRGVRIASDGTVLDPAPIEISSFPSPKAMGGIAWDGARFLVTWTDARSGDLQPNGYRAYDVYAARVGADGTVLDPDGLEVSALPGLTRLSPTVAALPGGGFAVAWATTGAYGANGIYAARVTGDGLLLDGPADGAGFEVARPTTGLLLHPVIVPAADGRSLLAWVENAELAGSTKSIGAAVLAW